MSKKKTGNNDRKKDKTFHEFRLEAAKSKNGPDIIEFSISTWESRSLISEYWPVLSSDFLRDVNERLKSVLFHVNEARMYYHSSTDSYFEGKAARYLDLLSHPNSHQELFHLGLIPLDFPKKDEDRTEHKPSGAYDLIDLRCPHLLIRESDNDDYDFFFAVQTAFTDLAKTDTFLDFHLTYTFSNNLAAFSRYLEVVIFRKYGYVFQLPDALKTAREWLKIKQEINIQSVNNQNPEVSMSNKELEEIEEILPDTKSISVGLPRIKVRKQGDNITSLSEPQTVLTIQLLREVGIIFKDESFQTKGNIAKAFQIVTGYSGEKIRQKLSSDIYDKNDLEVTLKKMENMISLINRKLKVLK